MTELEIQLSDIHSEIDSLRNELAETKRRMPTRALTGYDQVSHQSYTAREVFTKDVFMYNRLVFPNFVYNDILVNPNAVRLPAVSAPAFVAYKGSQVLEFSKTATNTVHFQVQLPHSYAEGQNIEFHFHLAYPNNGTGNTRWAFTYSWANITGTFPTETTVNVTAASPNSAGYHQLVGMGSLTGTGKGISSVLLCSLSRLGADGTDTYDDVVYVTSFDFHIPMDTVGSKKETSKN
jgi:hypothetical protein